MHQQQQQIMQQLQQPKHQIKLEIFIPLPSTVVEALSYTTNKLPNQLAMRVERNGTWKKWTWQQYRNDVLAASKSIISLGVHSRVGVNVIGFNSPEWHIAYLGAIHSNALPTGVYTTSSPSQCEYFATGSIFKLYSLTSNI